MKHSASVFRIQLSMFRRDKGMILFYLLFMIIAGIAVPFFSRSMVVSLNAAALFTVMYLKPLLAESIAGEREKKTLESLLSTPINGKSIIWGKFLFGLLFAVGLFGITAAFTAITYKLARYESGFSAWQWTFVICIAIMNFIATSIAGTYFSATSADLRTANSKVSVITYPLGLLLLIFLAVVSLNQPIAAIIVGIAVAILYLCISIVFAVRVSAMKQSKYYELVKINKSRKMRDSYISNNPPKTQFGIVFRHELRYLLTLKRELRTFAMFCFTSALVSCPLMYFIGYVDLNIAVLATCFLVPSVIKNLISYSIGGEKAFKTGESLLATPLRIRPIFLAKSMLPIMISATLITVSSLLTLAGANIAGYFFESGRVYMYSAAQLVLLFPVGIMSCAVMTFTTGILSMIMKTPRKGLYAASFIGMLFIAPLSMIVYLTSDTLRWSIVYFIILLLCAAVLIKSISGNINRSQLMNKL